MPIIGTGRRPSAGGVQVGGRLRGQESKLPPTVSTAVQAERRAHNLMNEHAGPLTTGERWKTNVKYIWPNIVRNIYRGMSQTTGENGPNNNRRNDDV